MPAGRPTVMTEITLAKLVEGFEYGFTDLEACLHAGISKDALYDYCEKHPEFTERKEILKRSPILLAKRTIVDDLKANDTDTAKWYLDRKAKDEFSTRQEISGPDGGPATIVVMSVEDKAALDCNYNIVK